MYCVNGKHFADLYRNKLSGYAEWCEEELDCGFYFNSANIGPYMSLDETSLSNGEVWTFLTNKDGHGGRGTLAAAVPGTKSDEIITTLIGAMGKSLRRKVKEVTCDLSPSMMLIAAEIFYNAHVVNDRFHVQQVYNEAVDEIRVDIRRQLIAEDNARDKSEPPVTYSNGETMRQILARSKHNPDDGAKQMDRHTATSRKHSVQALSDTERCLPSCDGTSTHIQYEALTDKSHGKNERVV